MTRLLTIAIFLFGAAAALAQSFVNTLPTLSPMIATTIINDGNVNNQPGFIQLQDGRLLSCFSTGLDQQNGVIKAMLSNAAAAGDSWGSPATLFTPPSGQTYIGCALTLDSAGHILLMTMQTNNAVTTGQIMLWVGTVTSPVGTSVAGSIMWDGGTNITANVTGTFISSSYAGPAPILILSNGTWLAFIYDATAGGNIAVVMCVACNYAAQSWSAQSIVVASNVDCPGSVSAAWTEMAGVVLNNNTIYGVARCNSIGLFSITASAAGTGWAVGGQILSNSTPGLPALVHNPATDNIFMLTRATNQTKFATYSAGSQAWSAFATYNASQYCYAQGAYIDGYASFAVCLGPFDTTDQIIYQQFVFQ